MILEIGLQISGWILRQANAPIGAWKCNSHAPIGSTERSNGQPNE